MRHVLCRGPDAVVPRFRLRHRLAALRGGHVAPLLAVVDHGLEVQPSTKNIYKKKKKKKKKKKI